MSLLIVDEFGEGFPVASCFSEKEDFTTLKLFCQKIKNVTGDASPAWFIAYIAPQFYDAFCAVFNCEPIQLSCMWHTN